MLRAVHGILFSAALSGCGAISALGSATEPLDAYDLNAPAQVPVAASQVAQDVIVEVPSASGALDNDRILIRPNRLQAQYLPAARWSEDTPVMVQTLILRSLENSGAFRYVGRRPLGSAGDFAIVSELTDFQAELQADGETALVRLRMIMRIVREADASIVGSRTFTASAASGDLETLTVVAAFDAAVQELLPDVTEWVLSSLSVRVASR